MELEQLKIGVAIIGGAWTAVKLIPNAIRISRRAYQGIATIEQISEQFKNNGGSSFKDSLDRLESLMVIEQARNRAVSTMLPAGMFECDSAGECIWVSPKYTEITGSTFESAQGWSWTTVIHEADRARVVAEWTSGIDLERRIVISYRIRFNGSERHVLLESFPVHKAHKCIAYIGLVSLLSDNHV